MSALHREPDGDGDGDTPESVAGAFARVDKAVRELGRAYIAAISWIRRMRRERDDVHRGAAAAELLASAVESHLRQTYGPAWRTQVRQRTNTPTVIHLANALTAYRTRSRAFTSTPTDPT
jgi:hypothetical protein